MKPISSLRGTRFTIHFSRVRIDVGMLRFNYLQKRLKVMARCHYVSYLLCQLFTDNCQFVLLTDRFTRKSYDSLLRGRLKTLDELSDFHQNQQRRESAEVNQSSSRVRKKINLFPSFPVEQ